jgi:uncharacterized protein with ParB-like and HNH nuclease domain
MAHIANKIDAKDKKLSEVLSGQRYRIDSFQREYRWQRKQIEALISDLAIGFKKNHKVNHTVKDCGGYDCYYMGPIVLCDTNNELSIVDGQQRLSSFTLLFIYLYHQQNLINNSHIVLRDIKPFLYVTKAGETTFVLNVKARAKVLEHLITNPDKTFSEIQTLESEVVADTDEHEERPPDESIGNLISRYEDITKLFPQELKEPKVLPIFIEWLLERVVIVEVKAYSMENAYTIFETMNDRGMTLNPTEILKAFLLHKINDDTKSDEANEFWKDRVSEIKAAIGDETELDFFRAWLRAKYAETKRDSRQGSENEDFELIGTQFHSWVKNNPEKVNLINSDDYYFFIRSDFDFFSNLYLRIFEYKHVCYDGFENIYCSNFYPIAESLYYPLLISPILKIDDDDTIDRKIRITAKFIDIYTLIRVLIGKAITQSTIRNSIYELVKSIRNTEVGQLERRLSSELAGISEKQDSIFSPLHRMDNWGFYHYLFARIIFKHDQDIDFSSLQRSKKQNSYILFKFFDLEDRPREVEEIVWSSHIDSVAGHCLVRRYDYDDIVARKGIRRLQYLVKQKYMPEMLAFSNYSMVEFISARDTKLREQIGEILKF